MSDNRPIPTCEGGCSPKQDCANLMCRLRKVDFAIYDTVLYLDVYPDCVKAQELYRRLVSERADLCKRINSGCNPINFNEVQPGKWSWTNGPWPWEPGAN